MSLSGDQLGMHQAYSRGKILEVFLFGIASLLLYVLGLRELVFLIPIQVVCARRGWGALLGASATTLLLFFSYELYKFYSTHSHDAVSAARLCIEAAPAVFLVFGIVIANHPVLGKYRVLVRLLAATLASGLLAVPFLLLAPLLPVFSPAMTSIFTDLANGLQIISSPVGTAVGSPFAQLFEPQTLMKVFVEYFLSTFLLYYFLILSFGYWAGTLIGKRTLPVSDSRPAITRFSAFRLESYFLWPLIICGGAILIDLIVGLPIIGYVAWNLGLLMLLLYGLQGLAIAKFIFEKRRLPRILWAVTVIFIVALLASPGIGIVVLIGIPAFGVSENWIRYRIPLDSATDDD